VKPGLTQRDQNRAGRAELLQTPFSKSRGNRDQLGRRSVGSQVSTGERIRKAARQTVGARHAFAPNSLFERVWKEEEKPWVHRPESRSAG